MKEISLTKYSVLSKMIKSLRMNIRIGLKQTANVEKKGQQDIKLIGQLAFKLSVIYKKTEKNDSLLTNQIFLKFLFTFFKAFDVAFDVILVSK